MSNVVRIPEGAMVCQRRTVAVHDPASNSRRSQWEIVTDLSRPTEDAAFKRIGVFEYMTDFIRGGCEFQSLEWAIIIRERQAMRLPNYPNAVIDIATHYKAPPSVIADMLNNISLKMTVRDFLGLTPLPIAPLRIAKQIDRIDRYRWQDGRKRVA